MNSFPLPNETVHVGPLRLPGGLTVPTDAAAVVLFAHGSGSSRHSPRNRAVAQALQQRGLATLLFDLLDESEASDRRRVFDIALLAERLVQAIDWAAARTDLPAAKLGLFGASTGAAAALVACVLRQTRVGAVVSRGGRPDLAGPWLTRVRAPTLLIVGGDDDVVLELNREALRSLTCEAQLEVVPGATHLFEEPGTLQAAATLAGGWFVRHLTSESRA